jgi:hypothetical protein
LLVSNLVAKKTSCYLFIKSYQLHLFKVIDEVPAVGLATVENFNPITLQLHKNLLEELYNRDKNHACVVGWSVANEPDSSLPQSLPYFKLDFS